MMVLNMSKKRPASVPEGSQRAAVSVSEMAALCQLSRSRFHALVREGIFPPPVHPGGGKRCPVFEGDADAVQDPWERFLGRVENVKRWLMSLPVGILLANSLCELLPFVADSDPAFVKLALDPAIWRSVVRADKSITEDQRAKRLTLVDSQWFGHVLNNALLHALGGLANNHFLKICDFLDHPLLRGSYTHLMPHYLFAVLFEKVRMLRRLSEEQHDLRGMTEPIILG